MRLRVLLADDCPSVRKTVRNLLEREGFQVVGDAADGAEAVKVACQVRPDIAILDLSMPGMNGIAAARAIREACPETEIVLLTVHTEEHQIAAAIAAGIRGYVVKARATEELVRAVRDVFGGGIFLSPQASRAVLDAYLPERSDPRRPDPPGATNRP